MFIFKSQFKHHSKRLGVNGVNGMVASIRGLIASYNNASRYTLQLLLNTI